MQQHISLSQIRLALGNWFLTNGIVDANGQTPNVDSFVKYINETILVKAVQVPSHNNIDITDPAEDNVCISCQ